MVSRDLLFGHVGPLLIELQVSEFQSPASARQGIVGTLSPKVNQQACKSYRGGTPVSRSALSDARPFHQQPQDHSWASATGTVIFPSGLFLRFGKRPCHRPCSGIGCCRFGFGRNRCEIPGVHRPIIAGVAFRMRLSRYNRLLPSPRLGESLVVIDPESRLCRGDFGVFLLGSLPPT